MSDTDQSGHDETTRVVSHFYLRGRRTVLVLDSALQAEITRDGFLILEGHRYAYRGPEFVDGPRTANLAVIVQQESVADIIKDGGRVRFDRANPEATKRRHREG